MGPLGVQETVFIFVLALLVFGPKKLPELGRTIGKAMSEFRRASSELKATFDREMNSIERENESLKDVTRQYAYDEHSYNHDSYYDSGDYSAGTTDNSTADNTLVSASAPQGAENQVDRQETASAVSTEEGVPTPSEESVQAPAENPDPQPVKS